MVMTLSMCSQPVMESCSPGSVRRAVQSLMRGKVEDVENQRGFARTGDTGHSHQQPERDPYRQIFQVELARSVDRQRFVIRFAAALRNRHGHGLGDECACQRVLRFGYFSRRARGDNLPAVLARARSDVDQIIGGFDQVEVVLHY